MTFRVGQKVECIVHWPQSRRRADAIYAEKGEVYTIRGFCPGTDGVTRLYLQEIRNDPMYCTALGTIEFGFNAKHFRPIVERKTDISIFTGMLKPQGCGNGWFICEVEGDR